MNPYQPPAEIPKFVCPECEARKKKPGTWKEFLTTCLAIGLLALLYVVAMASLKSLGFHLWLVKDQPGNSRKVWEL